MKTLIALNNPKLKELLFSDETINHLKHFSEVEWLDDYDALADVIDAYDACITSWGSPRFTPKVLNKAENLKFIGHGAGTIVPYIDEQVFQKDITVVNANYVLSRAAAEGTVAMMAAASYRLLDYSQMLKDGGWADNDVENVPGVCGYREKPSMASLL